MRRNQAHPSLDRPASFLPEHPPARIARWTAWLLLALAAAGVVFACVIQLPDVVNATFSLAPEGGDDAVQAPVAGEITSVGAREGATVKAGQVLFTVRSDEIRARQARLLELKREQRSLAELGKKLEEAHAAQLKIKDSEIAEAEREVVSRLKYRDVSSNFLAAKQAVTNTDVVARAEGIREQLDFAATEAEVAQSEKARDEARLQRLEIEAAREKQRAEEFSSGEKLKNQIATLEDELKDCAGDVKSIRAPYDGFVLSLNQHSASNSVAAGTELCQVARSDSRAVVRLILPESGVPRVAVGQRLQLRFVAFPYERYGSVLARLDWISPAAINGQGGSTFEGRATLLPGDPESKIVPAIGMRGQARILVGSQTLIEKALETFKTLKRSGREQTTGERKKI
jgi:membrane fusion protein